MTLWSHTGQSDFDCVDPQSYVYAFVVPRDYAGATATVSLGWAALCGTTGQASWGVGAQEVQNIGAPEPALQTVVDGVAPSRAGDVVYTSAELATLPPAGRLAELRVLRQADGVEDTLFGPARLLSIEVLQ